MIEKNISIKIINNKNVINNQKPTEFTKLFLDGFDKVVTFPDTSMLSMIKLLVKLIEKFV